MKYLISPEEKSKDWSIDIADFEAQLLRRWPNAAVERISSPESFAELVWSVDRGVGRLYGEVGRNHQVITLEGDITDCAEVAIWFRRQVPPHQSLVLYDEAYNVDLPLTSKTRTEEIIVAFTVQ